MREKNCLVDLRIAERPQLCDCDPRAMFFFPGIRAYAQPRWLIPAALQQLWAIRLSKPGRMGPAAGRSTVIMCMMPVVGILVSRWTREF